MKYLFSYWKRVEKRLKGKFIYLFLDYDGTLAPIAETPEKAVMPERTKDLLRKLSKMPDCKIAVVSGRSASDVKRRVGLKNIVYAGNHGFEIVGPKIKFKNRVPMRRRKMLNKIKDKMDIEFAPVRGVFVEDKGASLSVHYRLANKKDIPLIRKTVYSIMASLDIRQDIQVRTGKMVLEIRPDVGWDKGKVILWLLAQARSAMRGKERKILPIYIGDDISDEDAFGAIKNTGITVFAGKPVKSEALFYLKDTKEVLIFLKSILKEKSSER